MRLEKYFADITVYRLSPERYEAEFERYLDRLYLEPMAAATGMREWHEQNPERRNSYRERVRNYFGGGWCYNEIIGFIRLHFLGDQVRGEWWTVRAKRIVRTRRKVFEYRHWKLVYESHLPRNATNAQTFAVILGYLDRCRRELPGRYVDSRLLEEVGPFIDWQAFRNAA